MHRPWAIGKPIRFTRPFKIGVYLPGTKPRRIPYHLYLLIKETVYLMERGLDTSLVDKKIRFRDFFYSHLPPGWNYNRKNAASLIAGYDTSLPKYDVSGFSPFRYPVHNEFDIETGLSVNLVYEFMSLVHSRKTPTPEEFMHWDEVFLSFYCKLCSCFGIDYQNLEAASEDDVILMNMGTRSRSTMAFLSTPSLN
ncbi:uncharacterized protein LOC143546454 [Bidens hawaiensis]|uniref:uncharacterized protein LOC143546454 n=1 Tax=Bidens hawaiensis TaxID=980011 RepID=UPI00404B6460